MGARVLAFGLVAVLLPPGFNLLGLAIGWAVILIERGRAGIPLAALWSLAAVLANFALHVAVRTG